MNILKKNGFTLIELVAVITILAIIALITVPAAMNVVADTKKSAAIDAAYGYVKAIELDMAIKVGQGLAVELNYESDTFINSTIAVKGTKPDSVSLTITNGEVISGNIFVHGLLVNFNNGIATIGTNPIVPTNLVYANGTPVYFNPTSNSSCTYLEAISITGTKSGCMKWYTFNDGGLSSDMINLILDHNTTASILWNSSGVNSAGPTNILTQLELDTSSWVRVPNREDSYSFNNGVINYTINYNLKKARLITAAEIAQITGNSTFIETTSTTWFYLDSNNYSRIATTLGSSNYDWLFDYTTSCASYGCSIEDASNSGYWTSTSFPGNSTYAWNVGRTGVLGNNGVNHSGRGVRPVITIYKTNLL